MKQREDGQDTMHTPSPPEQGLSTHALYAATICYNEPTGKLYTDLMGHFLVQSSRCHKYILVAYNFDSNSIHVKPLKSRQVNDTIKAYKEIYNMLTQWGLKPRLHWLDNEASKALKKFIDKEKTKYQLTPTHPPTQHSCMRHIHIQEPLHQWFVLSRQISPLHIWCRLLDQAGLTLIMLHTSRINPNLSAHEELHGIHDFNATPLAPPGTMCITHEAM